MNREVRPSRSGTNQTFEVSETSKVSSRQLHSAYKPSGVAWLGDIPAHWESMRLKFVARLLYGDSLAADDREDGEFAVFGSNGQVGTHTRANTLAPALIIGRKGSFGKVNYSAQPCFAIDTTFIADARSAKADLRWLFYAIALLGLDTISQDSAVPGLSREFAYDQWLPVPSESEQRAIAAYLDRETARLDALIAKKERLIELLQEKRTALISHAVTRGLDAHAPLKDSGVEWLGKIPVGWEVKRLKSLFTFLDSRRIPLSSEERATLAKEYPYYGASGIIDYVENYLFDEPLILVAEDGANLFSRSSPLAFVARGKYWVNNHAHILKPFDSLIDYWSYVLAIIVYDPWITGSAQPKLTKDNLGTLALPVPPMNERRAIAAHLDRETAKIDALAAKVRQAIETLKEYRTALISAAVTGKVDVR